MKKILIAGACGYIGARLSLFLAERGFKITAFDSFAPPPEHFWSKFMDDIIIGDITDEAILAELTKRQFDAVINLISLDHTKSEQDPGYVTSINMLPTWNLLENFTSKGLDLFIYFSTQQVLGSMHTETITEAFLPNPINKYSLTHLLSENIVTYYHNVSNTNCINVRLSNGYGSPVFYENNCWWLVINDLCRTAFQESKIVLSSDGSPQRDFIHISDICKAIEVLLKHNAGFEENLFHLASGNTLTILELAHKIKRVFFKRYKKNIPVYLPDNIFSGSVIDVQDDEKFHIDVARINKFGYHSEVNLEMGVNEIFDYLESH
jgi:UDP-glucose 4-epimerase